MSDILDKCFLHSQFLSASLKKVYVLFVVFAILFATNLFAEESMKARQEILEGEPVQNESFEDDEEGQELVENEAPKNEDALPHIPIKISKFHVIAKYYGLPLSFMMGYFYRKNDVSVFPNIALNLIMDDGLVFNTSSGLLLQKSFFTWQVDAVYDIIPFTMNLGLKNQVAYASNVFSFYMHKIKLSSISRIGNKGRFTKKHGVLSIDFEVSQGVRLDSFLLDSGFFKSTLMSAFFLDWRPSNNFLNYRLFLNVPATFNLYYVDLAFMYSFYVTGLLNSGVNSSEEEYLIESKQSIITARESFKEETRHAMFHLFGTEVRWYPTRTKDVANDFSYLLAKSNKDETNVADIPRLAVIQSAKYNLVAKTNGFFLSLFTDVGFGITLQNKYNFIAEYGVGLGYTLFDCVPFTFQIGLNQRNELVFFLGVVSRIVHKP